MRLHVDWTRPQSLRDGSRLGLIYVVNLDKAPRASGVYVMGRRWGTSFEALYVGKGGNVRARIKTQLNNLRLMQHLKNAKAGRRVVLTGRIITRPGQKIEKCMDLVERALIRYFLSEGHDLVNRQGTRLRRHEVSSSGKHPKRFVPGLMYLEK